MAPDLGQRHLEPELMDDPGLDEQVHVTALRALGRVNALSLAASSLLGTLANLARQTGRSLRVLDVASGGGDVAIGVARRAAAAGIPLELSGCDVSAVANAYASQRARSAGVPVDFFVRDVVADGVPEGYDVVMSSLFLHHLNDAEAEQFLRGAGEQARELVLINDLTRCWAGYLLARTVPRLVSRNHVVHLDGERSIAAAFTRREVLGLAQRAGLSGARCRTIWPFRYLLEWQAGRTDRA